MKRSVHIFLGMALLACFLGAQTLFAPIIEIEEEEETKVQTPPELKLGLEDIGELAPHVASLKPNEQYERRFVHRLVSAGVKTAALVGVGWYIKKHGTGGVIRALSKGPEEVEKLVGFMPDTLQVAARALPKFLTAASWAGMAMPLAGMTIPLVGITIPKIPESVKKTLSGAAWFSDLTNLFTQIPGISEIIQTSGYVGAVKQYPYIAYKTGMWLASTGKQYIDDIKELGKTAFGYGKRPPSKLDDDASEKEIEQFKEEAIQYLVRDDLHFLEKVVSFESDIAPFEEIEKTIVFSEKEQLVIAPFKKASLALHGVANDILKEFEGQTLLKEQEEGEDEDDDNDPGLSDLRTLFT